MKRALVTGGSGAIGGAICRQLARDGLHVLVHANDNLAAADALAASLRAEGGSARSLAFDVTDAPGSGQAIAQLLAEGPIQVLVNNAGIVDDAPLPGMKREQWQRVLAVSLDGFYNVTQPLLMPMIRTRWGRIVNLSSVAGIFGNRGQSNYAAAKAGLVGFSKSLAREVASRNITVNTIAPGFIETDMTRALTVQQVEALTDQIPSGRLGSPADVAAAVVFLASDAGRYITGETLNVNGGLNMQ